MESENTIEKLESKVMQTKELVEKASTIEQIEQGKKGLDEIREILFEGVEWWAQFDVRRGQQLVESLEIAIDSARRRIKPRRRFKFKPTNTKTVKTETTTNESKTVEPTIEQNDDSTINENTVQINIENREECIKLTSDNINERGVKIDDPKKVGGGNVYIGRGAPSLWIVNLIACVIDASYIEGPVWITNCHYCVIRSSCRQLRMHESTNCVMRVDVIGAPIIEKCTNMMFAPLLLSNDNDNSQWKNVKDMSWLREGQSVNWHVLKEEDGNSDNVIIERGLSNMLS